MTPAEIEKEMLDLCRTIDRGVKEMAKQAKEYAQAEYDFRKAVAHAWIVAPEGTVPEKEAWVNGETAELRSKRDLAEKMHQSARTALDVRRAELSVFQSLLNAHRAEAEFYRTGPQQ